MFEIGKVFSKDPTEECGIKEVYNIAAMFTHESVDYTEARQCIDSLFASLGLQIQIKETEHPSYIEGRVAQIILADKSIGYVGELHPEVLHQFAITTPVAAFELDVEEVFKRVV